MTGGAGFIGQHVLAALLRCRHSVRVLDSLRPDVHRGGGGWRPPAGVPLIVTDVRDRRAAGQRQFTPWPGREGGVTPGH
ncbi:NAD-dependent epimerase/dehydratase family protein [Plastoroseomonas hellenica]|uniref:NAD-dependent epimerase/dehydratase family protein n=1 Tax=Plastoroseomonas hellenica TaxID=2687306 RepID=UPI001FE4AA8C|nr:NAD-dependent epimerase/dehydratase family protein [Plastoroseomonas hellenica]